jgi:hypothetical protein
MAKQEQDREDLLRDGKQMLLRGECPVDGVVVVVGFRSQGQASFYFGPDPVFQFNENGELRRVFFKGKRFAAIQGKLCELTRQQQSDRVRFVPQEILADVESEMMGFLDRGLAQVQVAIESPDTEWRISGGNAAGFRRQLSEWLANVPADKVIADAPNA